VVVGTHFQDIYYFHVAESYYGAVNWLFIIRVERETNKVKVKLYSNFAAIEKNNGVLIFAGSIITCFYVLNTNRTFLTVLISTFPSASIEMNIQIYLSSLLLVL